MPNTLVCVPAALPEPCGESPTAGLLPRSRAGRIKRRLTFEDKLLILDPTAEAEVTEERLMAFMNLFAFRTTGGIITRASGGPRDWAALRAPISPGQVARHLLADRLLPFFRPQWVGSRSPATSCRVTLDVDSDRPADPILSVDGLKEILAFGYSNPDAFATDREAARKRAESRRPFADRCLNVEDALRRLGPDPDEPRQVLRQPTPSAGRHYSFFLDGPYFLSQIRDLLLAAGLRHCPGQVEFFPSESRALRLPFGYVPGRVHDPFAWIRFTDDFIRHRIRRFSLEEMYDRLRSHPDPVRAGNLLPVGPARDGHTAKVSRDTLRLPASHRIKPKPTLSPPAQPPVSSVDRYLQLIENPITSLQDAQELFNLGILVPGTRTEALKRLAAHFIWFRHLSADEAAEILIEWAMDPGHRSKDIQADLAGGTQNVRSQIVAMCHWYAREKKTAPRADGPDADPRARYAPAELDALLPAIQSVPVSERTDQAHFFLNLMAFAKQHGRAVDGGSGWEVAVAINAVVRRWPGCRGQNRYKIRMDRAKDSGLLTMIKEKWQRPGGNGLARTYLLSVPCVDRAGCSVNYDDALARLTGVPSPPEAPLRPAPAENASPRSPDGERSREPIGATIPDDYETPDPRPVHPGGPRRCLGSRPPCCHSQSLTPEAFPHRDDEAVTALPEGVVADPARPGPGGTGGLTPTSGTPDGNPGPGQPTAGPVTPNGDSPTDGELTPRIAALLRKHPGQLTRKERRIVQDFQSRQRQRGPGAFDMSPVGLRQDLESNERKCRSHGDGITP